MDHGYQRKRSLGHSVFQMQLSTSSSVETISWSYKRVIRAVSHEQYLDCFAVSHDGLRNNVRTTEYDVHSACADLMQQQPHVSASVSAICVCTAVKYCVLSNPSKMSWVLTRVLPWVSSVAQDLENTW